MNRRSVTILAGGCALAGACYSLDITAIQPQAGSAFTREEVLRQPTLMELVVSGLFVNLWGGGLEYAQPWTYFSIFGEEITTSVTSVANFNRGSTQNTILWDIVREPRAAFDNSLTGNSLYARDPWSNLYEGNAAATEMPRLIHQNHITIIDPATGFDDTPRTLTFAKFVQSLAHIYLGLIFDSAAIVNEDVDLSRIPVLAFHPSKEVLDSGIKWMKQVIALADTNSFLLPLKNDLWVYNTAFTNSEMKAVAHSFVARALAYSARTPAERAAVNWQEVKDHILAGTQAPFGPTGFPNPLNSFDWRQMLTSAPQNTTAICNGFCTHAGEARVDMRLLGPADSSGAYQAWLAKVDKATGFDTVAPFIVRTLDKRIQEEGGASPLAKPTYFKYTNLPPLATVMPTERGPYYYSWYWNSSRALNNHSQFPAGGGGRNRRNTADLGAIQDALLLPVEMDLLLAEAEYRLGNLPAAVNLINKSRVTNGELPPVTTAGVPVSNSCVPKRYDGTCGSLFDALMYEKRIETYGTGVAYFDLRGWGCLLEGTMTMLPPPGRQLDLIGKPVYTYGGKPGQAGSAPLPDATNCNILVNTAIRGH
jgi:hypothetical protein